MKITRGFVKLFLLIFIVLVLSAIFGKIFNFYQNWMSYAIIGFLIFIGILLINKKAPLFGKFLIIVFIIILLGGIVVKTNLINFNFFEKEEIEYVNVTEVISGESFEFNGLIAELACVSAPLPEDEYYEESQAFLEDLILNKEVKIKHANYTNSGEIQLYVYVTLEDVEIMVNREVVRNGFGLYSDEENNELCRLVGE